MAIGQYDCNLFCILIYYFGGLCLNIFTIKAALTIHSFVPTMTSSHLGDETYLHC